MQAKNHQLPEAGPASSPVLYGVAHGLSEIFPLVELSSFRDEADNEIEELVTPANDLRE